MSDETVEQLSVRRLWLQRLRHYSAEFIVVFLGVWLSLLAEQFRENRGAREQEQLTLAAIAADLEADSVAMAGHILRATTGFDAAQRFANDRQLEPRGPELAKMLEDIGLCSFTGNQRTSRFQALRTGDLALIRDRDLRSQIDALYFDSAARDYLHARDCEDSRRIMQMVAPWVRMTVPPLERPDPAPGWDWTDQPVIEVVIDERRLLEDAALRAEIARLASGRQFLRGRLLIELENRSVVLQQIRRHLDL